MQVAAAVAEILKREGVSFLIGYPVNPIIEAAAEADIRTVIVRQERTGLHMADAVSRVTSGDTIGVFTMQHGPGSENAFGGVAQAYGDSSPIVVLPAGFSRRLTNIPPNFNSFLNFQHVTKSYEQLLLPDKVSNVFRRAFTQAKNRAQKRAGCENAQAGLRQLQSGQRVATVNSAGERVFIDDNERARQVQRAQKSVDDWCK